MEYMLKRVEMREKDGDCGICTFATTAGITYEESSNLFLNKIFKKKRNTPYVLKGEMEEDLKLYNINYYKVKHNKKWENLIGDFCIVDANKKKFLWHWIIYIPKEKCIIDPRIGKPEKIYDINDYWLWGPVFSVIKNEF